ncbi:hypothetical protein D3C72_1802440 [compost metagenome]
MRQQRQDAPLRHGQAELLGVGLGDRAAQRGHQLAQHGGQEIVDGQAVAGLVEVGPGTGGQVRRGLALGGRGVTGHAVLLSGVCRPGVSGPVGGPDCLTGGSESGANVSSLPPR